MKKTLNPINRRVDHLLFYTVTLCATFTTGC
jgi:hypothetical protein